MGTRQVNISSNSAESLKHIAAGPISIFGEDPTILSEIYKDNVNMSVWCRDLNHEILQAANHVIDKDPQLRTSIKVSPKNAIRLIEQKIDNAKITAPLVYDIFHLVKKFCELFKVNDTNLKLTVLHESMCPRFHVDMLPCRLITTYKGKATEWLQHDCIDRSKLGIGNQGKPDDESGLFKSVNDVKRLAKGDVAIMKGENWIDNEGRGLVHRSPYIDNENSRLLVSLDFASSKPEII
ncbi:MAG: hypothetical protein CBC29_09970 [Methylococcaceae bacterium TMED69]|nr:MAG: hypothetical protein CBC29_09970 [Methylococcaceae bacterium TMED69]|tara:strand:- start:1031 stop:1741 length:711 start_codon:yes stop_codon:yes gene_type:complete